MTESLAEANVSSAHFIGIGGAGMSGIALVLHERGCKVTCHFDEGETFRFSGAKSHSFD